MKLRARIAGSDTGRAAGLGVALMVNNFIALVFTVVFTRLLGASGYGSLGALLAVYAILLVPGSALQAAVARDVSAAAVAEDGNPAAGVRRWLARLVAGTAVAVGVAILGREPISALVGVDVEWAAAAIVPTAGLWLVLCVERGALQGFRGYRAVGLSIVGEAGARLVLGLALYGLGLGVTGAFLGTTLSVAAMALALAPPLLRRLSAEARPGSGATEPRLRELIYGARVPVVAFALVAALQNIDVVFVKHELSPSVAGSYAAASVAAKAVIWVAIGLGLYLLPEAVRRTRSGADARPVLLRTTGLIALVAIPMVAVYAAAPGEVLRVAFGDDLAGASDALPLLGIAMSVLAWGYLAVQYFLALGRVMFLVPLAIAPLVELVLLATFGAAPRDVAAVLVGVQLTVAMILLALLVRTAARARSLPRGATAAGLSER